MRKHIIRGLAAAAVACAFPLMAVATASAAVHHHTPAVHFTPSGGTPVATNTNCVFTPGAPGDTPGSATDCGQAGYVASGRDFRFASAVITVPDHPSTSADPQLYVALDDSHQNFNFVRAGILPWGGGFRAFAAVDETGGSLYFHTWALPAGGQGVLASVYRTPTGNSVQFTLSIPSAGGTVIANETVPVNGSTYTRAEALGDWALAGPKPAPAAPPSKTRDTQFFQGRFTTVSGSKGTFNGPWTLNAAEATSNGTLPPSGTLVAQPSYLWTDGAGIGAGDAFGVWRYPF